MRPRDSDIESRSLEHFDSGLRSIRKKVIVESISPEQDRGTDVSLAVELRST